MVLLELKESGVTAFSEATGRLAGTNTPISIWMDENVISYPTVSTQITDGSASITGNFTLESATDLANKINGGALPFKLETENFRSISATLGMGAKDAMVLAGAIAFVLVARVCYRFLPTAGRSRSDCSVGAIGGYHCSAYRIFLHYPQLYINITWHCRYHFVFGCWR